MRVLARLLLIVRVLVLGTSTSASNRNNTSDGTIDMCSSNKINGTSTSTSNINGNIN